MKSTFITLILLIGLVSSINYRAKIFANFAESNEQFNTGNIKTINGMNTNRAAHTATLLNNGKVLIVGGFSAGKKGLLSAELFDSKTNSFKYANKMNVARASHTATLLSDGNVLIAGGYNGNYLDSAEIYNPRTGEFTEVGKMTMPRSGHKAILLKNGKVLLVGGVGTGWTFLADAEIYDPVTKRFSKTGSMITGRESHTATLLKDGKVLVTGGHKGRRSAIKIYSSSEIYDPSKGTFTATANLKIKRHKHDATLLEDGRVLVVGGSDERDSRGSYSSVEIFDPKSESFTEIGNMNLTRYKLQGTTILLKNGKILIAGGSDKAEIYNPTNNGFEVVNGKFETKRLFSTATLLQNGQVLIVGGYDRSVTVGKKAWLYDM